MNKHLLKTAVFILSLLATSCEHFNIRDVSSENLDTLRLDQQPNQNSQDKDLKLADVRRFIGKRPSEVKLWETEPLCTDLQRILGNEYVSFVELMKNATPLKEEKLIYSIGSHPDLSRIGFGYIIIDPDKNLIRAGMVKPGKHSVYGAKVSEVETPPEIERKCKTIL
ncbi:MAG: hypothetical protein IPN08_13205 [Bacteroidales bacterium]|nr:hypothetical protein [Bacteroidales bacterium]MBK9358325.1 hypothetical protein [Bacteroidales bacterium]